jgi:hypothetical protein
MFVNKRVCDEEETPPESLEVMFGHYSVSLTPTHLRVLHTHQHLHLAVHLSSHEYQKPQTAHQQSKAEHVWAQSVLRWRVFSVSGPRLFANDSH